MEAEPAPPFTKRRCRCPSQTRLSTGKPRVVAAGPAPCCSRPRACAQRSPLSSGLHAGDVGGQRRSYGHASEAHGGFDPSDLSTRTRWTLRVAARRAYSRKNRHAVLVSRECWHEAIPRALEARRRSARGRPGAQERLTNDPAGAEWPARLRGPRRRGSTHVPRSCGPRS